ncbi:MAG: bifunctional oligoribonuclease/PAP phosphatase NrnA [Mailhella sp.]|nr:bifunctional oligoribonuclease/PAP phosphatase NrnA [Mailhella sp.]
MTTENIGSSASESTLLGVPAEIIEALRNAKRVLIAAHAHPDGDAIGSCFALAWAIRSIGHDALVFNEDGMPSFLRFLTLPGPVLTDPSSLPCDPDLIVVLDCGDRARAGEAIQPLLDRVPTLNIDHHLGNGMFGTLANWVVPEASATGILAARIARALRTPLQGAIAEALYVAVSTDTGNFSHGNTTPEALRLAADLAEGGLRIASVREKLDNDFSEPRLRLWARVLGSARVLDDGKFAAALATLEDFRATGTTREDAEGIVDRLRRIKGVRVAALLREEEKDGKVFTKASLRSSGADSVRDAAAQFGGGGHRNAAGCTLPLDAEKTLAVMHPYIRFVWNKTV